ncbi:MAG: hypothetical protein GTO40_15085 [Deltaproteobacteria bacterium]|nr:hypothetical protein [Deltaproteobacteria bacterium]
MKYIRIYTGTDGQSHFEDLDFEFAPRGDATLTTPSTGASEVFFRRANPGYVNDWHKAPRRQYVITLAGQWEIEVGDGSKRTFGAGDILLAEDVTGQGHKSKVLGSQPRIYAFVPLS